MGDVVALNLPPEPALLKSRLILIVMIAIALLAVGLSLFFREPTPTLTRNSSGATPASVRWFDQSIDIAGHSIDVRAVVLSAGGYRGRVVNQPDSGDRRMRLADAVNLSGAVVGVNGGYFDFTFQPAGLYLLKGTQISPAIAAPPYSAIVGFDSAGQLQICETHEGAAGLIDAIQAGPFVIDPGGNVGVTSKANQRAKRSIIAITPAGDVLVLNTSDASLFEAALILKQASKLWQVAAIDRAVNLDGGPSAALQVEGAPSAFNRIETGPVRNYLIFLPK